MGVKSITADPAALKGAEWYADSLVDESMAARGAEVGWNGSSLYPKKPQWGGKQNQDDRHSV